MTKNLLWGTLFANLLALGILLLYASFRPAEIRALLPRLPEVILAMGEEATGEIVTRVDRVAPSAAPMLSGLTGGATTTPSQTPAPVATPPPRRETTGPEVRAVLGRHVGPLRRSLSGVMQPPVAMYPFGIERRTFPTDEDMEITFTIRNLSGEYWRFAEVIMSGSDSSIPPQVFEVDDWTFDGHARFRYRFPRSEVDRRLGGLRVRSVEGERVETSASESLRRQRAEALAALAESDPTLAAQISRADMMEKSGGSLRQPTGLVGMWTRSARTLAGDTDAAGLGFHVYVSAANRIPDEFEAPEGEIDPAVEPLVERLEALHQRAVEVQSHLDPIVAAVAESGRDALTSDAVTESRAALSASRSAYDQESLRLALDLARSRSASTEPVQRALDELNNRLANLLDEVETQLRYLDEGLSLE